MTKFRLTKNLMYALILMPFLISSTCEEEEDEPSNVVPCADYNGPTGDPQSDSFCQAAWAYRCNGQNNEADATCLIYNQIREDNPGMPPCPYCP
jgi:hypothetical protein